MARKYTLQQELKALNEIQSTVMRMTPPITTLQIKRIGNLQHSLDVISRICVKYSVPGVVYGSESTHINKSNAARRKSAQPEIDTSKLGQKITQFKELVSKKVSCQELLDTLSVEEYELRWLCDKCYISKGEISRAHTNYIKHIDKITHIRNYILKNKYIFDFPLTIKQLSKNLKYSITQIEEAVEGLDFIVTGKEAFDIDDAIKKNNYSVAAKKSSKKAHETIRKNNLEKYGVEWVTQLPDFINSVKQTKLERYGNSSYNNRDKCRKTLLDKYGVDNVMKVKEIKDKAINTSIEKYGTTNPSKSKEVIDKISATTRKRYGVKFPCLTDKCLNTSKVCYEYNSITFDSKWELCYYIKQHETGIDIQRYKGKGFVYEVDGVTHRYFPDFIVDGSIVEIKGEHFFNEEGDLVNPFTNDEHLQTISIQKGRLMESLGVIIITDVTDCIKYVEHKYGTKFIESHRR